MHKSLNFAKKAWLVVLRVGKHVFSHSENWYHLILISATFVAGYWTYYIFISERNPNAHLYMDAKTTISTNTPSLGERRLVFLDVFLDNTGKRKIVAEKVSTNEVAYTDLGETIQYSCGIQIRTILTPLINTNKSLDWFDDTNLLQCPQGIPPEIDLLGECELPDGTPDFWIEPSDQCHLGHALILAKGDYLIKLHFIGANPSQEFWSRILYMQVN
jgi:hypothetical protein